MAPLPLRLLQRSLGGATFPAFVVCVLVLQAALAAAMLVVPLSDTSLAAFAQEFKVWCFGYDPEKQTFIWAMVLSFTSAPLLFAAFVALLFGAPLRAAWRRGVQSLVPALLLAVATVAAANVGLVQAAGAGATRALPFPAESLRTAITAPDFELVDHRGQALRSADLRGRVVMVTAVYSTCGTTCPMILNEAQRALAELTAVERRELTVVGITLDPRHDTTDVLAAVVRNRALDSAFRLATAEPDYVEHLLDRFSIARRRNPETNLIEHQNVFILIDRHGRIAYRLSSGSRQEHWLGTALRGLIREPAKLSLAQASARR